MRSRCALRQPIGRSWQQKRYLNTGSMAAPRIDCESPAEDLYTFLHSQQPKVAVTVCLLESAHHIEPYAVIADDQLDPLIGLAQFDPHMLRPCMPNDVCQRFLSYPEAGNRQVPWHFAQVTHDLGVDARALLVLFSQPSQGGIQTAGFQHRRTKLQCEATYLLPCPLQDRHALIQARLGGSSGDRPD